MNSISFNAAISGVSGIGFATKNNNTKKSNENVQQKNITELPSFCALKPLTEDKKCKKMLLDAKDKEGHMRFLTNDEIHLMEKAIKNFKTTLNKTYLLKEILTYTEFGQRKSNDLTAKEIAQYFKYMSGKPASVQKLMATHLSNTVGDEASKTISLLAQGKISAEDFGYIDEKLKGDDLPYVTKQGRFDIIMKLARSFPEIMKDKNILVDRVNMGAYVLDIIYDISNYFSDFDYKNVIKLISLQNEKNDVQDTYLFIQRLNSSYHKNANLLVSHLNKDNFDYIRVALCHEHPVLIVDGLKTLKSRGIDLPKLSDFKDEEAYYDYVNNLIEKEDDEEIDADYA